MSNFYEIVRPVYRPAMRTVSAITNAFPAVVTTNIAHGYITGTTVRLYVPTGYGMVQANHKFGEIDVLSDTTFSISIDTRLFDTFSLPTPTPSQPQSQSVPIGENNLLLKAAVQNVLRSGL